jgi:hypothetical protein
MLESDVSPELTLPDTPDFFVKQPIIDKSSIQQQHEHDGKQWNTF